MSRNILLRTIVSFNKLKFKASIVNFIKIYKLIHKYINLNFFSKI